MGCCLRKDSSSIAVPLITHSHGHGHNHNRNGSHDYKWTANAYYSLITTLQTILSEYLHINIPMELIVLIVSYTHIGLNYLNKNNQSPNPIKIDEMNRLLIHYVPDSDTTHYTNTTQYRCDYIHSDASFKSLQRNYDFMGHVLYFEVKFMLNVEMIQFLKNESMGISVGFRSQSILNSNHASHGMLGWSKGTIGLHNDDGRVFCTEFSELDDEQSQGRKSLETCFGDEYGDTVGCGYNHDTKHVFFTKNGKLISSEEVGFLDLDSSFDATLVFLSNINMITSNEFKQMNRKERECLVEFNFGAKQYEFGIDNYNGQTIPKIISFMNEIYYN